MKDLVKGDVTFQNQELDDLIIQRTDGSPTYNFVVVIDDHEMKVTHVVRGDDHLNNTPKQLEPRQSAEEALSRSYEALGLPVPEDRACTRSGGRGQAHPHHPGR